jgi:3,4-dehydroadipyl-CoA semialdehyde dehydrogenase
MISMETLRSYVREEWVAGTGEGEPLVNPTTEEVIARSSAVGIDRRAMLAHGREVGGPALRVLTFAQRGEILRALSKAIYGAREELIELGVRNAGNTRGDAKFDVDGASGTLMAYADLGKELGDATFLPDGDALPIGRSSRFAGRHFLVPRQGVALHINAFNFPAWGLAEKLATAILAGMPVVSKPAPPTALLTVKLVERLLETGVLPKGALQLLVGEPGDLLDHLEEQDVLAFTGSAATGAKLRGHPALLARSVRVNIEADSLNAAVLAPDVELGTETFQLFLNEVTKEATQKAGQKCTATRRIFVPSERLDDVRDALVERLTALKVGDPGLDGVNIGPLPTQRQLDSVREGIEALAATSGTSVATGGAKRPELTGIAGEKGYFVAPTLLVSTNADNDLVHEREVFGPVTTLLPYDGSAKEAVRLVRRGKGGLVASVYTDDRAFFRDAVLGIAAFHGRVVVGSAKTAGVALGPGVVLPQFQHGGPGRAGGGEELGGVRGLSLYLQRVAVQGYGPLLDTLLPRKEATT